MPVPERLGDWTFEVIRELCQLGQVETDRHDFKAGLPDSETLTKIAAAFANSKGGFVIVGVKERSDHFLPEGIDPDQEIAAKFGQKLRAVPAINFEVPKSVAVPGTSQVIYIFHVPHGIDRPHLPVDADKRIFWKRTNTGCEQMTLEEIRAEFMRYEERREKIKLLFIELVENKEVLQQTASVADGKYSLLVLDTAMLDRLVVDLYTIIQDVPDLMQTLSKIRRKIGALKTETSIFMSQMALSYGPEDKKEMATSHRDFAKAVLQEIGPDMDKAIAALEKRFGLKRL
jgi:hypothetical protein